MSNVELFKGVSYLVFIRVGGTFFCSQCPGFHQLNYQPFTGVIAERGEVATGGKVGEIGVTGETGETEENEGSGERGNTMVKGEGGECTINS